MQIDLIASKSGTTFVVDCKHWKRTVGKGSMLRVAKEQLRRANRMAEDGLFDKLVPMILTWRDEAIFVLENGVPVVPIHRLTDFMLNWDRADSEVLVLESEVHQRILGGSG
jgi:Holliday junction resolvase-like predicted endonuclease